MPCFNGYHFNLKVNLADDIQGTGAVVAAGFINACKLGTRMEDQVIVIAGAGPGGKATLNISVRKGLELLTKS